jgi:hypothetical protein
VQSHSLELEFVPAPSGRALDDFERIYEGAFPPEERAPTATIVDSIASGSRLLVTGRRGGRQVAMAVFLPLTGGARGIQFLEYLAVDGSERGDLRSDLMRTCLRLLRGDERGRLGIVLEVEAARADGDAAARRLRFDCERNGAVLVEHAPRYFVPRLSGVGAPRHFHLMWLAADGPAQLTGALLRACVEGILTLSYDLHPLEPLTTSNLDRLTLSRL